MMDSRDEAEDELELLLPWYVNGTLDAATARRIEAALPTRPRLAASLAALREDRDAALSLGDAVTAPESMEARFLAQLAAEPSEARPSLRRPGVLEGFGNWMVRGFGAMSPARLGFAAVAALVLVALQTGLLVSLAGRDGERVGFEVATGSDAKPDDIVVLVTFAPDASLAEVGALLAEQGGRIADGPLPGGLFRLRFAEREGRDQASLVTDLAARTALFASVLPGS